MYNHEFLFPLLISIICITASQIVFINTVKTLFHKKIVILTALFITCNPGFILFAWNGLETSLFLLIFNLYLNLLVKNDGKKGKNFFFLGILAGLLFLARTDSFFLIALSMLYFYYTAGIELSKKFKGIWILIWGIISIIVAIPWLIFNYLKYGNVIQDSASSLTVLSLNELFYGYEADYLTYLQLVFLDIGRVIKFQIPDNLGYPFLILIFLALYGIYASMTIKVKNRKYFFLVFLIFFVYSVLLHSIRISIRDYYFAPFFFFFIFLLSSFLVDIFSVLKNRCPYIKKIFVLVLILCIIIPIYSIYPTLLQGKERGQMAYDTLNNNLVPLLQKENFPVVGMTDSGSFGWFYNGTVVNLDGLVNHDAYNHIKSRDMISFLREYQIRYFILVHPAWMKEWYMGKGSGLRYISMPISGNISEISSDFGYSNDYLFFRDYLTIQKSLISNSEINNYYYNNTIMPQDSNISHYLGYGWKIPYLPKYRFEDYIDEKWFPFTSHYSKSNDYATSKGSESNIYLPLKLNESYRVNLSLSLNTKEEPNISRNFIIDNQTQISAPISPDITNITLNITATQDITHILMRVPNNKQDPTSVNLWGIYITNLSDTTT
jgi:hypothetical protein